MNRHTEQPNKYYNEEQATNNECEYTAVNIQNLGHVVQTTNSQMTIAKNRKEQNALYRQIFYCTQIVRKNIQQKINKQFKRNKQERFSC